MCPHCGTVHPIDPNYETMDITRGFASLKGNYELPKAKSRRRFLLFCAFLGIFGVHWFYILRPKRGMISLLTSIVSVGLIGSLLLLTPLAPYWDYVIAFGTTYFVYILEAILLAFVDSPKDGRGEFLR